MKHDPYEKACQRHEARDGGSGTAAGFFLAAIIIGCLIAAVMIACEAYGTTTAKGMHPVPSFLLAVFVFAITFIGLFGLIGIGFIGMN